MNVLIIDDHPQIAESFKSALHKITLNDSRIKFEVTEETTLDGSYALLTDGKKTFYDLIFLDIKLPSSNDGKLLSGEDLGLEIRKQSPKSKIIVATTYNDNYRINNIFRNLSPEGLLIKNDLTPKVLINAIEDVLDDSPAYTKTVKKLLRILASNDISLDYVDRQILYQLSIGTKMMDLPNVIPMSIGGIERRKRHLKEAFDIVGESDKVLLKIARDKGFI